MRNSAPGFTLVEVLVALVVSSLVFLCISDGYSYAVKRLDRERSIRRHDVLPILSILRMQLLHGVAGDEEEGGGERWFAGNGRSLTFATQCSVQGLHDGVAALVRYVYDGRRKRLCYAELPLALCPQEQLQAFAVAEPADAAWEWRSVDCASGEFRFFEDDGQGRFVGQASVRGRVPEVVVVGLDGSAPSGRVAIFPKAFDLEAAE